MYSYEWDTQTGGYLLNSSHLPFSKEPRPVYYKELDILGFDKYWAYEKNDTYPYMWAEASNYFYRGRRVAKTKGGSVYTAPELIIFDDPEPNGEKLRFVDIETMVDKNKDILESIVQGTIKKVYNTYVEYQSKIDVFYVAFSGGKDSIALLDIVQRALPHNSFKVLFGDTGMEFSDTYTIVEKIRRYCEDEKIEFITARSHLSPIDSWKKFGPPAQIMRWCCSVHKTAPQILLLRELLDKPNFKGMAFTGVRADESVSRSEYDDISLGKKHKGQYTFHPLLEWNSAELYLYIFSNNLLINSTYKKGNSRAGCLVCPMAGNKNEFFKEQCYSIGNSNKTTTTFNEIILNTSNKTFNSEKESKYFMDIGGWKARRSGKELAGLKIYCTDSFINGIFTIEIFRHRTSWREWLKTVGAISEYEHNKIKVIYQQKSYELQIQEEENYIKVVVRIGINSNIDIHFMSALKTIFKKSAYCIGCRVCEANCPNGYIRFFDNDVHIDNRCVSCKKCHDIPYGCLVANSLRLPKGDGKNMKSIDRYFNMGIELDWIVSYFKEKDIFFEENSVENTLGSKKIIILKRFLGDAGITSGNNFSHFGSTIEKLGVESEISWGLILSNLVYTSQFNWYIKNISIGQTYATDAIKNLIGDDMTDNSKNNIVSAYKNIFISIVPLGKKIGLGLCDYELKSNKRFLNSITRAEWTNPDPLVILYSLYKFAEACGDYYQFTLSRLLNHDVDSDGVSPTEIFGLDRKTMEKIVNGLSVNYPEYISASFTLDLDNITLRSEKLSKDVLNLF